MFSMLLVLSKRQIPTFLRLSRLCSQKDIDSGVYLNSQRVKNNNFQSILYYSFHWNIWGPVLRSCYLRRENYLAIILRRKTTLSTNYC